MVPQHDEAAALDDAAHLAHRGRDPLGRLEVVQGGDGQRQVERVGGEWQRGGDGRERAGQAALAGSGDHRRRQVDAEDVVALAGDGGAKLAGPAADVQHQAAQREQVFDESGALVDVVLGDVAREDVVVFVGHRRVQGVLALLGIAQQTARQQQGDAVLRLEDAPAARAAQRLARERTTTIQDKQGLPSAAEGKQRAPSKGKRNYAYGFILTPCLTPIRVPSTTGGGAAAPQGGAGARRPRFGRRPDRRAVAPGGVPRRARLGSAGGAAAGAGSSA